MSNINYTSESKIQPLPGYKHSYRIADLHGLLGYGGSISQALPGVTTWGSERQNIGGGINKPSAGTAQKLNTSDKDQSSLYKTCADTSWVVLGQCQNEKDKFFAKRIYCGKEWCPVCGKQRSRHHNRKIARVLPKAMQIESMGYFVIEFPDAYRKRIDLAYSKKGLQQFTDSMVEVLAGKRQGRRGRVGGIFSRGLIRWHWFGDKYIDGHSNKWNPHLNVLVDSGYIENERLEEIKTTIRAAAGIPDLIIHYSYCDTPAQMFQRVEYITRATFRDIQWNDYMAHQLYGFRNQRWFGSWKGEAAWHIDPDQEREFLAADELEKGHCPDCGGDMVWTKPLHAGYLTVWQAEEIGETGYYRLPVKPFDGDCITPAAMMRLDNLRQANIIMRIADRRVVMTETLAYMDDNFEDIEELPGEFTGREVQGEIYLN